jgi:thiosulfate dehydrogenase (quinone) large subunit
MYKGCIIQLKRKLKQIKNMERNVQFAEPPLSRFLFGNTKVAWFWLIVRVYVGWEWLLAGWEKMGNPVWVGSKAGVAVKGFLTGALQKTSGPHPDVQGWYASFIEHTALPHAELLSYLVTYGEILVGVALILGVFTGIAAFFGTFMNLNYLFAGTVSTNPILFLLQLFLILAWRIAGWYGLDRYILPALGTPWQAGQMFKKS